jgi:D-tyrosyl-tRNA(Tyr) deacylase
VRAVAQRVASARVTAGGAEVCATGPGLLALVGVGRGDAPRDAEELARRLVHLRVFDDEAGRMNRSLLEVDGTLCVVSQFTLYGETQRGRRPSWARAAPAAEAEPLLEALVHAARAEGARVVTGRFQASMQVALVNDGPVTLLLDTERRS